MVVFDRDALDHLVTALRDRGFDVVGPTVRDGAVVLAPLESGAELPCGIRDEQNAGRYRLRPGGDGAVFAHAVGPGSFKRWLYPPEATLWAARRTEDGFALEPSERRVRKLALLGARSCDVAALAIHDRVLASGPHLDADYAARRAGAFVVAVDCLTPGGTCFCASTGTGPSVAGEFDLRLTELCDPGRHLFLVEAGSDAGREVLRGLPHRPASDAERADADERRRAAADRMGRALDVDGLPAILARADDDPRWEETAERCLACGSCTLACPTCFCHTVEDRTGLSGERAERVRLWDSCFTLEFSYIHGGSVRASRAARYRHWLTHKLSGWVEQFGTLGCVGCGRCITWCPAGIDHTVEARSVRESHATRGVHP